MRFELTSEQRDFAGSLERLLAASDCVGAARAWAAGEWGPGLAIWNRLSEQGVHALLVPESDGGMGASHVELAIAFEAIGRHALPGPYAESVAFLSQALVGSDRSAIAEGAVHTGCTPVLMPLVLDPAAAVKIHCVDADQVRQVEVDSISQSVDPARRLGHGACTGESPAWASRSAVLATAAQLLGLGEHLLTASVAYVGQRKQFGRAIGSYQAIKHQLADVRIALDFARPLVFGAAVSPQPRSVSAAKVGAGDAAYLAARTALQVHGAIGYTRELDLSAWLLKVRALQSAWGTAEHHRAQLAHLIQPEST